MLDVKFPVPFLIGSGNLLKPVASGFKTTLSNPLLNLKIPLLTFSKHSFSVSALKLVERSTILIKARNKFFIFTSAKKPLLSGVFVLI